MAAITQYLMQRKSEGRPLTADEDQQLQKFYYNRASTILKKIVLLKQGETPPQFTDPESDDTEANAPNESSSKVDPATDQAADNTSGGSTEDQMAYDTAVANDNTAYNNKRANKLVRQEEESKAEHQAEDREEMDELAFDQKVAQANEHYNEKLLKEVQTEADNAAHVSKVAQRAAEALQAGLHKQKHMSKVEVQLEKQKKQAEAAVLKFSSEQKDAEAKVQEAEKAKADADAEALKASRMLREAEAEAKKNVQPHKHGHGTQKAALIHHLHHIQNSERLSNMVQYLRTALSHHNTISKKDLQIMQNFFLQNGGRLLSQLAEIEPDATWNDKGVMGTEQWAMDHGHPDQLSKEWGGKKVKQDTLVRDVVEHELYNRESPKHLKRPEDKQAVEGLFGIASKLPLKFAPDHSQKMNQEPSLGEDMDDDQPLHTYKHSMQSM